MLLKVVTYGQFKIKKGPILRLWTPVKLCCMHGNYQVIYQNNKYPDGPDLSKFL